MKILEITFQFWMLTKFKLEILSQTSRVEISRNLTRASQNLRSWRLGPGSCNTIENHLKRIESPSRIRFHLIRQFKSRAMILQKQTGNKSIRKSSKRSGTSWITNSYHSISSANTSAQLQEMASTTTRFNQKFTSWRTAKSSRQTPTQNTMTRSCSSSMEKSSKST